MIPKAGTAGRPLRRRRARHRDRGREGPHQAARLRGHHRDRARLRQRPRDRRRLAAPAGDEPRRRRLRRLDGHADHRHRRHPGRLLHAGAEGGEGPRAAASTATRGTASPPRSSPPAAPTASCRSTARSATSPIPTASPPRPAASATMGMVGKWAIHPSQVEARQRGLHPPEAKVAEAREILAAMTRGRGQGPGCGHLQGPAHRHRLGPPGPGDRHDGRTHRRLVPAPGDRGTPEARASRARRWCNYYED